MVDIEGSLSAWRIRSRTVRDLGVRVRDISIELSDMYSQHFTMSDENVGGYVEGSEASRLAKEARRLAREAKNSHGEHAFDRLALRQFGDDMSSAAIYFAWVADSLEYFGIETENKIKPADVIALVDGMFLPNMPEPVAASLVSRKFKTRRGLAHRASIAEYHEHTPEDIRRRRELLAPYELWGDASSPAMRMHLLQKELERLLPVTLDCLTANGLITGEERANVESINREADALELRLERERLGGHFTDFAKEGTPSPYDRLIVSGKNSQYGFRAGWHDNIWSWADGRMRTIDLRENMLLVSQDRKTGAFHVFLGDAYWTFVHEMLHILHWTRSMAMPVGLNNDPRTYSWANYPHVEGVTSWGETAIAMAWLKDHYKSLDMTDNDLEATMLRNPERDRQFRARLFYRTHVLSNPSTAAKETFIDTGNTVYRSEHNFPQEKLADLLPLHSYGLGESEIAAVFSDLRSIECDRLGSQAAADAFIAEHEPLIRRGIFTGGWTLAEIRPWMFDFYMPKLRKLVKANPPGSQVVVSADISPAAAVPASISPETAYVPAAAAD